MAAGHEQARWPGKGSGVELAARDLRLLRALPRYGYMSFSQVCRWFYADDPLRVDERAEKRASERLSAFQELGLVRKSPHEGWVGGVFWSTDAGVRLANQELPVTMSTVGIVPGTQMLHKLCVNDVMLRAEAQGYRVFTEREVRALEQRPYEPGTSVAAILNGWGVPVPRPIRDADNRARWLVTQPDAEGRNHYPDGVVVLPDGKLRAVEVELTRKEDTRALRILRSYARASAFHDVLYYVTPQVYGAMQGFEVGGMWRDGWLQQARLLPPGQPSAEAMRQCKVRLATCEPLDDNLLWKLDMNTIPETRWVTKTEWQRLRNLWAQWCESGGGGGQFRVPFLVWWEDELPRIMRPGRVSADQAQRFMDAAFPPRVDDVGALPDGVDPVTGEVLPDPVPAGRGQEDRPVRRPARSGADAPPPPPPPM